MPAAAVPLPFAERFKTLVCAACRRWSWALFAACPYCHTVRTPAPTSSEPEAAPAR